MADDYGAAVRAAREQQGHTQRAAAWVLKIHAPYLCLIEKGNVRPGVMIARRIERFLGVPDPPDPRTRRGRPSFADGPPSNTIEAIVYAARFVVATDRFQGVNIDRLSRALAEGEDDDIISAALAVTGCGFYKGRSIENLGYVLEVYLARTGANR